VPSFDYSGSDAVLSDASNAISAKDADAFIGLLSESDQSPDLKDNLVLDGPGAEKVKLVLDNAVVVETTGRMVVYESMIDGENISFYTTYEEDGWKIHMF
jgi:hypothetical protein